MNVYDFDNTIYAGDSTRDFYCYCIKKRPRSLVRLFTLAGIGFLYFIGKTTKTALKQRFFLFLRDVSDIDAALKDFWDAHIGNIYEWYIKARQPDDVIISASPEFLLRPACERLGVKTLIASPVDKYTGKYAGLNCDGEEKAKRFKQQFPDSQADKFYSDSDSDLPMALPAREAYKVKGGKINKWERNGAPKASRPTGYTS